VLGWMGAHPRGTLMSVRTLHAKKLLLTIKRSGYLQSKSYHYVAYWSFLNLNFLNLNNPEKLKVLNENQR
jgi:hypothetical protein